MLRVLIDNAEPERSCSFRLDLADESDGDLRSVELDIPLSKELGACLAFSERRADGYESAELRGGCDLFLGRTASSSRDLPGYE